MATNFPTSIDTNPGDPTPNETLKAGGHANLHGFAQDAIVAIETYLGVVGSAVTSSITYMLNHLTAAQGGTGLFVYAIGDMIYATATNVLARLAIGTNGQVLTIVAGAPAWSSSPLPTGVPLPYCGGSIPTGFLLCDGSAVSRSTYSALFSAIGTGYGPGDGSTTFNLPDGRGRTFIGAGTGTKVATFASRASNVITVTGLTNAANNEFQTGQAITYHTSSGVMTGLTNNTVYYLIRTGNLAFSLATTLANAQNGVVIALSSDGTGTQTFTLTLTARAVGDTGGEENHAMSITELVAHAHPFSVSNNSTGGSNPFAPGNATGTLTVSTGGNAAMNNMAPFFGGNWMIKT